MADAIVIAGTEHSAHKGFYHGTQRTAAPETTLENIRRVSATVGLTRLADVTGLDRIGIPTVVGYRPNSPTLTVSGGKGFTTIAATVSAGMEAVEIWHAENPRVEVVKAPYVDLHRQGHTMSPADLPLTKNSLFDPHRPEAWVWGWDLIAQQRVAVPYASVSMGNTLHRPAARWMPFAAGSNGLAGGNHILEAVAAGLYEVAERDAVACSRVSGAAMASRVDPTSITSPLVTSLFEQFAAADISAYLFDCTVDTAIPTYMAVVADQVDPAMGLYRGYGAHLDPSIAMIRALTEAAQARLLLIAGSRDDYFDRNQRANRFFSDTHRLDFDAIPATVDGDRHPSGATDSFHADITSILARLQRAGLSSAVVVDLTHPELGIPVARVVVPGLEGYIFDFYQPGPRARAHQAAMAQVAS